MEREPVREGVGKPDTMPLLMKLYFQEVYTEVARVVGYSGFPHDQLEEKMKGLVDRFGRKKIQQVCSELITLQFSGENKRSGRREDAEVRLKDDVRKFCWQLLGPPPEKKAEFERGMIGASPTEQEAPKQEAPLKAKRSKKKPRKKTTEAMHESPSMPAKEFSEAPKVPEHPVAKERGPETPIMQQYREAKKKHPEMLLLFRIGDFFELFEEDATKAHNLLGLTLTTRDRTLTMAGFPHHQLESYLHKLLKAGQRVAICEPVEESLARGPIKREVTRVVTSDDGK